MTREGLPPNPDAAGPPDDRDPTVAAWLAVEPLDEVTRARLVRGALAAVDAAETASDPEVAPVASGVASVTRPSHRIVQLVAVAAVLLVVLAVSLAVLLPRGDDTTPTALDRTTTESDQPGASSGNAEEDAEARTVPAAPSAEAPASAGDRDAGSVVLPVLGDLGDVSTAARLRDALAALDPTTSADRGATALSGCLLTAARALGTPVATGTGTIDGEAAVVVMVRRPDGATAAVAARGPDCAGAVSAVRR